MLSCDRFKEKYVTAFLQVFKCFIQVLWKWLNIEIHLEPIKSKEQKQHEMETFKVSGIENPKSASDDTVAKSAEELFKEDMQKSQQELEKEIEESEGKIDKYL